MPEITASKYMVQAGWNDVPHLSEGAKAELLASTPPHLRDARSEGDPSMGAGAIYPVPFAEIEIKPFVIPVFWPRAYAMDVGWNRTAALWGAKDPADGTIYLYAEHYRGKEVPVIHAEAIKTRGKWIRGAIDPASRGRQQSDGEQLIATYKGQGLNLIPAVNAVEAGIYEVWQLLVTGRLKVFSVLGNFKAEYRIYRRDENGKIIKANDHLMDCFEGNTLVWTDKGQRRIADLVGTEGHVVTIGGRLAPYHSCQMYGRSRPVIRLRFADGSNVVCTPDHRFLCDGEWVQAIDMLGRKCDTAVSQGNEAVQWSSPSFQTRSKSSKGSAITSAASIFSAMAAAFMWPFGSVSTAAASPMGTMSTTGMRIGATTIPRTSNSRLRHGTSPIIRSAMAEASPLLRSLLLRLGTAALPVWNGIASTMRKWLRSFIGRRRCFALTAALASSALTTGRTGSAPMAARQRLERLPASTMRRETASAAVPSSSPTSTLSSGRAAGFVRLECLAIEDAGTADVYCLTVPETAAFAVGNGVIAHNCLRYLINTWPKIASVQAPERGMAKAIVADRSAGY